MLIRGFVPLSKENSYLKWCPRQSVINWSLLFTERVGVQRKACTLPLLPCDMIKPFVHVIPIPQVCQLFWAAFQEVSFIVKGLNVGNVKSSGTDFSPPCSSGPGRSDCSGLLELRRQIREVSYLVSSCWTCIANCKLGYLVCLLMFKN